MSSQHEPPLALVLDWDGTVTEIDTLHMVNDRFGDPELFGALEDELGRRLTLDEAISREIATVTAPLAEVVTYLLEHVRVRPGFEELVEEHDPLIVSAGFHELIDPILEREGVVARVAANSVVAEPTRAGARRSATGRSATCAASAASAEPSPASIRSPTSATASPTAAYRSQRSGGSPGGAWPCGSTSSACRTSRSVTCTTSPRRWRLVAGRKEPATVEGDDRRRPDTA